MSFKGLPQFGGSTRPTISNVVFGGGAPAFSPDDLTSLQLWIDAEDYAVGDCSALTDKSPNAMAFTRNTGGSNSVAANILNGKKGIYFPADNDGPGRSFFDSTAAGLISNTGPYTVYFVVKHDRAIGGGNANTFLTLRPSGVNAGVGVLFGGVSGAYGPVAWPADGVGYNALSNPASGATIAQGENTIACIQFDGVSKASASSYNASVNGYTGISGSTGATYDTTPTTYWRIGQTQWGGQYGFKGWACEVLLYSAFHDATTRATVLSYLTDKYGL